MQRILLVDDDRMTLEFMRLYLESEHFLVYTAENSREAFKIYEDVRPNIVLTDIELGNESGVDLVIKLREKYGLHDRNSSKIIGITGHSLEFFEKHNSLNLFDKILHKPLDFNQLLSAIS